MARSDLYHTCGRKLLIYQNPHRAICPKHGLVATVKEMLIPRPEMGGDARDNWSIAQRKRRRREKREREEK